MPKFILLTIIILSLNLSAREFSLSLTGGMVNHRFQLTNNIGNTIGLTTYLPIYRDIIMSVSSGRRSWLEPYGPNGNSFTSIPVMAGIRAPFWDDIISPYFAAEIGFEILKRSYTYQEYQENESGLYDVVLSETRSNYTTNFSSRIALGSTISITNTIGFDVIIRYSAINYEYSYVSDPAFPISSLRRIFIYDFTVGIFYNFY